ncbi:hypothetical protein HZH68_011484 [Vespula germanica]|uniref:Uncharacterized protein n=1 Tax=Vespula germanica TaxID=30212 RepID=A0A834JNU8_VESGE|nr:hypothetical protein HZH68_011484 [Vespula germanica]
MDNDCWNVFEVIENDLARPDGKHAAWLARGIGGGIMRDYKLHCYLDLRLVEARPPATLTFRHPPSCLSFPSTFTSKERRRLEVATRNQGSDYPMEWDFGSVKRGDGERVGKERRFLGGKEERTSTWAHLNGSPSEGPQVPGLTTMENQQSFVLLYNGTLEEPSHRTASSTFLVYNVLKRYLIADLKIILDNLRYNYGVKRVFPHSSGWKYLVISKPDRQLGPNTDQSTASYQTRQDPFADWDVQLHYRVVVPNTNEIILIDVPAMVTEITKPRSEVPSGKRDYGNEKNSKSEKEKKQSVREEEEEDCEGWRGENVGG